MHKHAHAIPFFCSWQEGFNKECDTARCQHKWMRGGFPIRSSFLGKRKTKKNKKKEGVKMKYG